MKIALICALALAAPALAHAAGLADEQAPSITVRYGDLDLSRQQDAKTLLARIDDAAMQSCGAAAFSDPLQYTVVRRSACRSETIARAVAQIGAPALKAAFQDNRPTSMAQAD
jgi:UrcA family protein